MKPAALILGVLLFVSNFTAKQPFASDSVMVRAKAALSKTNGEIRLSGLKKPVEVFRDPWGVPHIFAQNQDDLFFAQGFVAAQDRLWQMEMWRRAGEGTLSEVVGPSAIEKDKFARLLRYRGDLEQEYKSYSPDSKQIINSFVQGVNAFIEASTDNLPIEFQLMGFKPKPWTPEVCLTRLAGFTMTRNMTTEVSRAQLVKAVGPKIAAQLQELDPPIAIEIPEGLDLDGIDRRISAGAETASTPPEVRSNDGSNNWVVSGALTATGKPILANDPHRQIALPSLRYISHLVAPGWNVIGAGEPALPGIAAGHNDKMGFGFTIVGIDQQDLYVEEINPDNPLQYKDGNGWKSMEIEKQGLPVRGKETMPLELHFTKHGPVIFEDAGRHRAYVLRWVGSEPGTAGYLSSLTLDRAKNWTEFESAMDRWKVPSENIIYADTDGNIGWHAAGLAPVRKGWSGLLPVPGNSGKYEWQGFLPMSELPHSYNPPSHFIATANHKIIPDNYKHEIGFEWSPDVRFRRISEVLSSREGFTIEDFMKLQHDELSLPARSLVPLLKNLSTSDPDVAVALKILNNWDYRMSADSAAAALFELWQGKLNAPVMKGRLPKEAAAAGGAARTSIFKIAELLANPDKEFGTDPKAARDAILIDTLKSAVADTKQRLGDDQSKWRWGTLHQAPFKHPLSGDSKVMAEFDLNSVARGGDGNTVNATSGARMLQTHGASFREILDLSDWDKSVAVNVPGQSGQPGSAHYGDLLPLWANGKYFPLLYSRKAIEAQSKDKLILLPKN